MAFCVLHGIGWDLAREGVLLEIRDIIPILAFYRAYYRALVGISPGMEYLK